MKFMINGALTTARATSETLEMAQDAERKRFSSSAYLARVADSRNLYNPTGHYDHDNRKPCRAGPDHFLTLQPPCTGYHSSSFR